MDYQEENGCLYVGSYQFNTATLQGITGNAIACTLHYADFSIDIDGKESAAVWAWWTRA